MVNQGILYTHATYAVNSVLLGCLANHLVVLISTCSAISKREGLLDKAKSICAGLIRPTFVLTLSVYTDIQQGNTMFKRISQDNTFAAWRGLQNSKFLHCCANVMPLTRNVFPKS